MTVVKKVLVTGGAGFIGSHLVEMLSEKGFEIRVIDNLSTGRTGNLSQASNVNFWHRDIRNFEDILPVFEGVKCVFHLAAQARIQPSIINPRESFLNNSLGTLNVLWAAKQQGVKRLIFSGSSSVYGDQKSMPLSEYLIPGPKNPYAQFKLDGENYCRLFQELYNLPTVRLRYFNVYGERQPEDGAYATVIGIFLRQRRHREWLTIVGTGQQRRDFTYVKDVARANLLAMESKEAVGEVINIGSGSNYSVKEVADLISSHQRHIPPRPGEAEITLADISKAQKLLGWNPKKSLPDWLGTQLD